MTEDRLTARWRPSPLAGLHTVPGVVARQHEALLTENHHPGAPAEGLPVPDYLYPAVRWRLRPGTEHLYTGGGVSLPDPLPALPDWAAHQGEALPTGISPLITFREMLQGGPGRGGDDERLT